jgi:hypothetical protein
LLACERGHLVLECSDGVMWHSAHETDWLMGASKWSVEREVYRS